MDLVRISLVASDVEHMSWLPVRLSEVNIQVGF
jgi:hypothetical protein